LDKTGEFSLFWGVEGTDGDEVFEEFSRFGETVTFQGEGGLVFFESPVNGLPRESGFLGLDRSFSLMAGVMVKAARRR
jgi:hypothetical protein